MVPVPVAVLATEMSDVPDRDSGLRRGDSALQCPPRATPQHARLAGASLLLCNLDACLGSIIPVAGLIMEVYIALPRRAAQLA